MGLKLIIIFAFICSALTISAQTINSQIDQYLSVPSEMGNFSGAVLVAKEGEVIFDC